MTKAYATSNPDKSLTEVEFSVKQRIESLMYQFKNSSTSVNHDCSFHIAPDWPAVRALQKRFQFIHGNLDGINTIKNIGQVAENIGASVHTVSHSGHLVFHSHFNDCIAIISKLMEKQS
jgi:predicted alpha/beta hydrolase family esterase